MSQRKLFASVSVVVLIVVLVAGFFVVRETQWWADFTATGDDDGSELPTDLTEVFNTAIVERADVEDVGDLSGELLYQGQVDFVHRVEPDAGNPQAPAQRTVTSLPSPGQFISLGDVLYETNSTPVFLGLGEVAAWRTLDANTAGDDVAQLQDFLVAGGWADGGFDEPGVWSTSLTTAVETWQESTGQTVTGIVELGDIWFVPGPIRVTGVEVTEGVVVQDGAALFAYTSQERAIEATVDELPPGLLDADDLRVNVAGVGRVDATLRSVTGGDDGFDIVIDADVSNEDLPAVDGIEVTVSWTLNEIVDALTLPPEALRRVEGGAYVVDILVGDAIDTQEVEVVGQAGRLVAITGVEERARVLVP